MNLGTSSGQLAATGSVYANPCALLGVDLTPPATGYSTLLVYDSENSTLAGKLIVCEVVVDAGFTGVNHEFYLPLVINRGIYCALTSTGTGSHFYVRFYPS